MANLFAEFLAEKAPAFNAYFTSLFEDATQDKGIERYLYAPFAGFSENAGKRHRPLICMLAAQAVGGEFWSAKSAAAAIEHFQSAALIHDDIADEGQLRRGKPCLYLTEQTGPAINIGDLGLIWVTDTVLRDASLADGTKLRVLAELTAMTERTIEGQALDLGWVRDDRFDLTTADYLTMATHKTAYYSGATPLACGAIIGGGTEEQIEALRAFGLKTGLAFQIQDDLLNLLGEKGAKPKDFRSDITEGKRTLVAVHAIEHASQEESDELVRILRAHEADPGVLARAVEIMEGAGSIAYARDYALGLTSEAKALLAPVELDAASKELFMSMADFFVERLS